MTFRPENILLAFFIKSGELIYEALYLNFPVCHQIIIKTVLKDKIIFKKKFAIYEVFSIISNFKLE